MKPPRVPDDVVELEASRAAITSPVSLTYAVALMTLGLVCLGLWTVYAITRFDALQIPAYAVTGCFLTMSSLSPRRDSSS